MKRIVLLGSLISSVLFTSCVNDRELQSLRADTSALERQSSVRQQGAEARLQGLGDRVVQFEKTQMETRRDLAKATATLDELRVQLQRLQGDLQETQYRARRGVSGEAVSEARASEIERRLSEIEEQLSLRKKAAVTPLPSPQTESAENAAGNGPNVLPAAAAPAAAPTAAPAPAQVQAAPATSLPRQATPAPQPRVSALPSTPRVSSPPPPAVSGSTRGSIADQLYTRAVKNYQEKNYEAAVVNFKQYLKQAPKSADAAHAQYMVGESLYAQKQYEAAIVAFDEVVQKFGRDPKVAAAMLKQGYAFAELKDARNARFFLQQVQKKYPASPEAQQAAEKLKQLR